MGEGRQGRGRARRSKPQGLARRRGRRAGLGDRKGQSRSLSHEGEGFFQVRRQRLTWWPPRAERAYLVAKVEAQRGCVPTLSFEHVPEPSRPISRDTSRTRRRLILQSRAQSEGVARDTIRWRGTPIAGVQGVQVPARG